MVRKWKSFLLLVLLTKQFSQRNEEVTSKYIRFRISYPNVIQYQYELSV